MGKEQSGKPAIYQRKYKSKKEIKLKQDIDYLVLQMKTGCRAFQAGKILPGSFLFLCEKYLFLQSRI